MVLFKILSGFRNFVQVFNLPVVLFEQSLVWHWKNVQVK